MEIDIDSSILSASEDPKRMEDLYQAAQRQGQGERFTLAINTHYSQSPENLLLGAWYYRLQAAVQEIPARIARVINWKLALPLSFLCGLSFWLLSDVNWMFMDNIPYFVLFWAPVAAAYALIFLTFTAKAHYKRMGLLMLALAIAVLYVLLIAPTQPQHHAKNYLTLMVIHLPLLAWIILGANVLGARSGYQDRFAFLVKSFEVAITAGLFLIVGVVFGMITLGMFQAISVELPEQIMRLIAAGGFGLLPVLAVAVVYDPQASPSQQDFSQGLSKVIATMMRLVLPLTLVVLVIYLLVIPFFFFQPFENRDVLIVYNVFLFAIMAMLIGATPVSVESLSPGMQRFLRNGILVAAGLAVVVSLYALSALIYRTVQGGVTMNRLTTLGWNTINIAILALLVAKLLRKSEQPWAERLQATFSLGAVAYVVWDLFVIIAIPIIYR